MRLLVSADWHLGAGSSLGRTPGDRLADQRAVTQTIVALAVERDVDAVLLAGDLLEGPQVTPEQLAVIADFAEACPFPIVAVSGNGMHDASMREVNGIAIFDRLANVHVYSRPGLHDLGVVQIACLPWTSPARLVARYGGALERDKINEQAASLTVRAAAELCDPTIKPTVLLMHGSISGASLPAGISTDLLHEPVLDVDALLALGYRAVVAGHIHVSQFCTPGEFWEEPFDAGNLVETPEPVVFYTGSPMPLNFGEANVPHGVWILDVDATGARAEFVPIDSRPLKQTSLDLAALDVPGVDPVAEFGGILDATAWPDVDGAIVKVSLRATKQQQRRLDVGRLRTAVLDAGAHTVKIEVETVREDRARVESVTDELEPLDAFDAWVAANGSGDAGLVAAARERMVLDLAEVAA